jgi:hypothetical protein
MMVDRGFRTSPPLKGRAPVRDLRGTLLAGWLLMIPPYEIKGDRHVLAPSGDKRRWIQESAYDTAADCETAPAKLRADGKKAAEGVSVLETVKRWDAFEGILDVGALCVPAEHVYPPAVR